MTCSGVNRGRGGPRPRPRPRPLPLPPPYDLGGLGSSGDGASGGGASGVELELPSAYEVEAIHIVISEKRPSRLTFRCLARRTRIRQSRRLGCSLRICVRKVASIALVTSFWRSEVRAEPVASLDLVVWGGARSNGGLGRVGGAHCG